MGNICLSWFNVLNLSTFLLWVYLEILNTTGVLGISRDTTGVLGIPGDTTGVLGISRDITGVLGCT